MASQDKCGQQPIDRWLHVISLGTKTIETSMKMF